MRKGTSFVNIALLILMLVWGPGVAWAQQAVACESDMVVQAEDWLSKIAQKVYNDPLAYPAIVAATNAKAQTDSSYATIPNPDLIEPGWKLCIPSQAEAQALLGQPAPAAAPAEAPVTTEAPAESGAVVRVTFMQLNDIYELTPVSGGTEGGLARVATILKQLEAENPNTFMALAGDLFSPSAIGTARVGEERLAGKQMVAVMNDIGLDFMTFGNHEFDLAEEQFRQRMSESKFTWVSSNVFEANGQPFPGVNKNHILTVTGSNGQEVKLGLIGVTLGSNPKPYVTYTDPFAAAAEQIEALRGQVDILVGITHLPMSEDMKLSSQFPDLDLIIGGHEHENMTDRPGPEFAPVYKADANARTVYIHDLAFNTETKELTIDSRLQPITQEIADDPQALESVNYWVNLAFEGFRQSGFNPEQLVTEVTTPLDGLEASVRNGPTELTELVAESMLQAAPGAELAIYNGGSIRIDDIIPPGPITEYDVIRILPFGGLILSAEMKGSLLQRTLDQGQANQGNGGYLQTANVSRDEATGNWLINGEPLDAERVYVVAINDFLLTGREQGLDFLNQENNPEVKVLQDHSDVRVAMIERLKQGN